MTKPVLKSESLDARARKLEHVFQPACIAVVGASASRGKWSNDVFRLLVEQEADRSVVPVNPNRESVEAVRAYPTVAAIPDKVDYALIVVPRDGVIDAVRDCVEAGVPAVHVLSSGFGEVAGRGRDLQEQLRGLVEGSGTVLIGPNSMGVYSARSRLTFASGCHFDPGGLSFVSQSGGLCYDMLARGQARGLKFGKILSVGNCADLDWPDYVRYSATDAETDILALYIESVGDGRRLFEELRAAAKAKPVLVLKGGKSQLGSQSVVSHTGRLAAEYHVWKAMLRQAGATEVESMDELLIALEASDLRRRHSAAHLPDIPGTAVIGTGGGATVLIADACEAAGLSFARFSADTRAALESCIPGADTLGGADNPVDIGADRLLADPGLLARLVETVCADAGVATVLIHLNLIAVANNLSGGHEAWTDACDRLATARRGGRTVTVVLRNGDAGDFPGQLQNAAMARLRGRGGIPAFSELGHALALLRHVSG